MGRDDYYGDYISAVPDGWRSQSGLEPDEGRYFLADFLAVFAFFLGVNGCGGVCSMRRSTSSVLRWSSSGLDFSSLMAGV